MTARETQVLASSSDALHDLIVGTADADALRNSVIRLFAEFDALVGPGPVSMSANAMAAFAAGEASAPPAEARAPEEDIPTAPAAAAAPAATAADAQQAAERRRQVGDRRNRDRRNLGQALRVPVQRLNELVRVVSELVINRSTFEQHHAALIEQVDELKLSTARLRRVTHRLESDYEVRALGGGNVDDRSRPRRRIGRRSRLRRARVRSLHRIPSADTRADGNGERHRHDRRPRRRARSATSTAT